MAELGDKGSVFWQLPLSFLCYCSSNCTIDQHNTSDRIIEASVRFIKCFVFSCIKCLGNLFLCLNIWLRSYNEFGKDVFTQL